METDVTPLHKDSTYVLTPSAQSLLSASDVFLRRHRSYLPTPPPVSPKRWRITSSNEALASSDPKYQ